MQQISFSGPSNSDKSNYKNLKPGEGSLEYLRMIYKAEKELKAILMKPKIYNAPFDKDASFRQFDKYKPSKLKKSNLQPYSS